MKKEQKQWKYYIVYQTTNLINGNIYVGCHATNRLNDSYIGSGKILELAIKKYGKINFKRNTLFMLKTKEKMYMKEKEIVNKQFIENENTYNIREGGGGCWEFVQTVKVKDKNGNKFLVKKDDPRYLSGEFEIYSKNMLSAKDKNGKHFYISTTDPKYLNGELVGHLKGLILVKDKNENENYFLCNKEEMIHNEYVPAATGNIVVKDSLGNIFTVKKDDPDQPYICQWHPA
jgi:hypothetical protein